VRLDHLLSKEHPNTQLCLLLGGRAHLVGAERAPRGGLLKKILWNYWLSHHLVAPARTSTAPSFTGGVWNVVWGLWGGGVGRHLLGPETTRGVVLGGRPSWQPYRLSRIVCGVGWWLWCGGVAWCLRIV
jgi:hypothetical protein